MRHVLIISALENLAEKRGGSAIVESLTKTYDLSGGIDIYAWLLSKTR